ncbi:MAG: hypothetical protein ACKO5K_13890 [Armatimonadota bacterium]
MSRLHWCCASDNDLWRAVRRGTRHADAAAALAAAREGDGVLLLADHHPSPIAPPTPDWVAEAGRKRLRVYIEFAGISEAVRDHPSLDRAVVPTGAAWAGTQLPPRALLGLPTRRRVPVPAGIPWLLAGRMAGYDTAVFGIPSDATALLVETRIGTADCLMAATPLCDVVRARFGPVAHWQTLWSAILAWLDPTDLRPVAWTPAATPTHGVARAIGAGDERRALRRGVDWLFKSGMIVSPEQARTYAGPATGWPDRVGPASPAGTAPGDGSLGVLEGLSSRIDSDGGQPVRWWRRADCCGETAGNFALAGTALGDSHLRDVAQRIGDWLLERSILTQGKRARPDNPAYGLIGWNDVDRYYGDMDGHGVYYADDMARCLLGVLVARTTLDRDAWDNRISRAIWALFRIVSRAGFVPDRLDEAPFEAGGGWQPWFRGRHASLSAHYQGMTQAILLRASALSGDPAPRARARAGLLRMAATHPGGWNCANGSISLEEARMLLPLAWLVRAEDTPAHRALAERFVKAFAARQDRTGFPLEALARPDAGVPRSNAEYGVAETSLLQKAGDPVADLLYTANFAAIGLHELAALGIPGARACSDALVAGLVRAQVRAPGRPQLDGAWYRAFDFRRWEYWASNADVGWGAWATETGWTQSWICLVLALRHRGTSLWDATEAPGLGDALRRWRPRFVSDALLAESPADS